ncbi:hypothetical protein BCY84_10852 [Trypanosoma cruzi cruzi]|nr:hypothetical protein BCY84_10852 [Trypanosoma cruzi cruzi]
MRRLLVIPWRLFPMAEGKMRTASLFFTPGIPVLEEDFVDEELLARLLVQEASPVATPTAPGPLRRSKFTTPSTSTVPSTSPAVPVTEEGSGTTNGEVTLATDMFLEEGGETTLQRSALPMKSSRRGNQHVSKYSYIRNSMHTKLIKEGAEPVRESALEWMCSGCRTYNFVGRRLCRRCKQRDVDSFKHTSPPARHIPLFPAMWACHSCGFINRSEAHSVLSRNKFFCEGCGIRFSGVREWYCPSCHCINSRGSTKCATCYHERPHLWTCSYCKYDKNSIFFTECHNCLASRSRQVSDSTVLCPTCHQRNDVQWEMCFFCMTPLGMMVSVKRLQERLVGGVDKVAKKMPSETEEGKRKGGGDDAFSELATAESSPIVDKGTGENEDMQSNTSRPPKSGEDDSQKCLNSEGQQESNPSPERISSTREVQIQEIAANEDGSWWCDECQVLQRRNAGFCDICLKPKVFANSGNVSAQREGTVQTGWTCLSCAHQNEDASRQTCEKCHNAKPQGAGVVQRDEQQEIRVASAATSDAMETVSASSFVGDTGQWRCPYCRKMVDVTEISCCGVPREIPFGYWLCDSCCSTNRDERANCMGCGAAPPAKPWRCFLCRFGNNSKDLFCVRCGSAHPHHWECAKCGTKCQQVSHSRCFSCGAEKTTQEVINCEACCAPNHASRRSCYRCRGRLSSDKWRCGACGSTENERQARRCETCGSPREYNMGEIIWICDVCDAAVASGGDLPERTQCPLCYSERTERSLCLPSRWRCQGCGVLNSYSVPSCLECGGKRVMEGLHTHTTCSSCFRITVLTKQEQCSICGADLSSIINKAGTPISLNGIKSLLVENTPLPTSSADGPMRKCNVAENTSMARRGTVSPCSTRENTVTLRQPSNEQRHDADHIVEKKTCTDETLGGRMVTPYFSSSISPSSLAAAAAETVLTLVPSNANGNNFLREEVDEPEGVMMDVISEEEEDEEKEVDLEGVEWSSSIPSWMCVNCETKNLEETETCACCGLRRGDD